VEFEHFFESDGVVLHKLVQDAIEVGLGGCADFSRGVVGLLLDERLLVVIPPEHGDVFGGALVFPKLQGAPSGSGRGVRERDWGRPRE
jgi:hypothetical protein